MKNKAPIAYASRRGSVGGISRKTVITRKAASVGGTRRKSAPQATGKKKPEAKGEAPNTKPAKGKLSKS
jgi:hypothetical protein